MTKVQKERTVATVIAGIVLAVATTGAAVVRSHDLRITTLEDHSPSVEWREEVLQRLATIEALLESRSR